MQVNTWTSQDVASRGKKASGYALGDYLHWLNWGGKTYCEWRKPLFRGLGPWTTQKRGSKLRWNTLLLDCECHVTACLEFLLPQPPNYSSVCTCHRVHAHGQVCNSVRCARSLDPYSKAVNSEPFPSSSCFGQVFCHSSKTCNSYK